ncbi:MULTISPECIES: ABC transporter ATP-binding protein [Lactobacillus]|uniref:ABC transporter ATP-binding protein n=1 Tax=Lactobacillus TaxID=1578 RepID=UPI002269EE54|nr:MULTISPECIES: ABC transporter ATP-binding protein [Lactobacillus]MCO6533277.1 ABC transporter ATP-binding protein [Lactobacillus sp.]MCX8722161.1 ABC transporter ATP-binding protein [Lactobacillus sp. B4010]MCX8732185.1 ABC transporter ATP-binding protein [Lactobacillus sp. B4015]MCX8734620.1 ABC transporter ATP-binding protein [Lactobacillus sp. B4012]
MAYLINLTHLQKSYGKQTVLHDINLNVMPKEIVGLIGPSGAGKSTTIKTMLGMEKVDSGETLVLGTQMPNRQILSQIGYMAQSDALYETLSAKENLQFFGKMKGVSGTELEQEIAYTADVVELTADLNKRVANYSGGMKRRLSLAIALLGQPELLVLDEPTVGIDPSLRRKIWHELKLIRDQGRSVLITTHVMDEAELTDRVALLLNGKIIAFAEPKKLEEQYQVDSIEDVFLKAESEEAAE